MLGGKIPLGFKKGAVFFLKPKKMEDGESWLGNDFWWGVTVGKKSSHFCEGKPINLHYPPNTYTNYHVFPPKVLGKTISPFFWKVEISKRQLQ